MNINTLAVNVDNFVFLFRDREGEDTHQNVIHDTVLSFGKVTYSTLYLFASTAAVEVKLAFFHVEHYFYKVAIFQNPCYQNILYTI